MKEEVFNKLVLEHITNLGGFYNTMDRAHGLDHFKRVFDCGVVLNNSLPYEDRFSERMIFAVAYTHDIFTAVCREHHHTLAGGFVRNNAKLFFGYLCSGEIEFVALACEQHRASYTGKFTNPFCELMNSADRELPTSAKDILGRAVMYREDHFPHESKEQVLAESIQHLKDKFGHGGYARYPDLYERIFKEELDLIRDEIAHM